MPGRIPLMISGDLHAFGETRIHRYDGVDISNNPIISLLSGPIGTQGSGQPSVFRGVRPLTPAGMDVDEPVPALEENGFSIADFTPEKIGVKFFRWSASHPEAEIDRLQPFHTLEMNRPG